MRTWNSGAEKKKKGKGYSVGGQKSWKELLFVEGKTPVRIDEPAIAYWDFLSITLLLWTAIVAPFEVAFGVPNSTSDPIFAVDRIVDCCFFFDVILQFRTTVLGRAEEGSELAPAACAQKLRAARCQAFCETIHMAQPKKSPPSLHCHTHPSCFCSHIS